MLGSFVKSSLGQLMMLTGMVMLLWWIFVDSANVFVGRFFGIIDIFGYRIPGAVSVVLLIVGAYMDWSAKQTVRIR